MDHLRQVILFFLCNSALPKNAVENIIRLFQSFLINVFLPELKRDILKACKNQYIQEINEIFNDDGKIFDHVSSEKKILSLLDTGGIAVKYVLKKVGCTSVQTTVANQELFVPKDIFLAYVPLNDSLASFLQLPDMFNQVNNYLEQLYQDQRGLVSNIVQTKLWKKNAWGFLAYTYSLILVPR